MAACPVRWKYGKGCRTGSGTDLGAGIESERGVGGKVVKEDRAREAERPRLCGRRLDQECGPPDPSRGATLPHRDPTAEITQLPISFRWI